MVTRSCLLACLLALPCLAVERWGQFELTLQGPDTYSDAPLAADFHFQHRTVTVDGFYDGHGVYKVRFMPDEPGDWTYSTHSRIAALNGKSGAFHCDAPSAANHGPVSVSHIYHFTYADGSPYYPIGTTSYAWTHQGDALEEQTLATLRASPFNKMRMCIFPKNYDYNKNEPQFYPFPRDASGNNDFSQFNPEFFQHLEKRVRQLMDLGIEADLILFHPYDRWGYSKMPASVDDRYLKYAVARLASFRNVWWSLANEYDFMKDKKMSDWDRFFRIVQDNDPSQHLRSIHNSGPMYDHAKPWVTHVSVQSSDLDKAAAWRDEYRKPVIYDECKYEGDIPKRWGNLSAQEMVRRFWLASVSGAYAGHGETYLNPNDVLWWSKGGVLHGESAARIAFLRKILEEGPPGWMNPADKYYLSAGKPGEYYLYYFDVNQPAEYEFPLLAGVRYRAEIIDPWAMTIKPVPGTFEGKSKLKLPAKPYQAVRIRKAN
jgi:hypothetical protein